LRIFAKQDLGVEKVTLTSLNKEFTPDSGCIIKSDQINWKLTKGATGTF